MDSVNTGLFASCFQFPESVNMNALHATLTMVTIHATCRQPTALCPQCQQASDRVHSCYERVIADVPCGGRQVRLLLTVRKFVCRTSMCAQRIFTERVPDFVLPSARLTNRLRHLALQPVAKLERDWLSNWGCIRLHQPYCAACVR